MTFRHAATYHNQEDISSYLCHVIVSNGFQMVWYHLQNINWFDLELKIYTFKKGMTSQMLIH